MTLLGMSHISRVMSIWLSLLFKYKVSNNESIQVTINSQYFKMMHHFIKTRGRIIGSYLLHPTTFHPRTLILNFSSLYFIPSNSSFLFNPHDFSFTNSSPTFYPTPCNPFQIICYISYPLNSYSSKWDLLFHTFNLIHNISSSSNHSFDFISLIWSCIFKT